jgi:hypothetical protein
LNLPEANSYLISWQANFLNISDRVKESYLQLMTLCHKDQT